MSKKSKSELQSELKELQKEKNELLKAKSTKPDAFSKEQQERLSSVTEQIVDLEEQIELAEDEPKQQSKKTEGNKPFCKEGYVPKPGTEKLVHLKIVKTGNRYDPDTGKEVTAPYIQMFTYGEYKNFVKNASLIGMKIDEVLYNPYKD